ncbi:hypothetical protein [Lacrimispora amygdalina]|nr:hypothetical protein [Lacrimispora amygdalina]
MNDSTHAYSKRLKKEIKKMRYLRQLLQDCLEQKTTLKNKEWLVSDVKIE